MATHLVPHILVGYPFVCHDFCSASPLNDFGRVDPAGIMLTQLVLHILVEYSFVCHDFCPTNTASADSQICHFSCVWLSLPALIFTSQVPVKLPLPKIDWLQSRPTYRKNLRFTHHTIVWLPACKTSAIGSRKPFALENLDYELFLIFHYYLS